MFINAHQTFFLLSSYIESSCSSVYVQVFDICIGFQTKKGVKRKADTTTPIPPMADPYEPDFDDGIKEEKLPKMGSMKKIAQTSVKVTPNKIVPNKVVTPSGANNSVNMISTPVTSAAKITPARRESNRQIKKPKRELEDSLSGSESVSCLVSGLVTVLYLILNMLI